MTDEREKPAIAVALEYAEGTRQAPVVVAKGLTPGEDSGADKLSYTAPSDSGGVEVRNQRGQIQQAATDRARRAETDANAGDAPAAETTAPAGPPRRGAFGQRDSGTPAVPANRAERRAQGKK